MISKAASYGIQSLAYLAMENRDREYVPISEISAQLEIPYHFLKKVIADLVVGGLLVSHRSAKGGIALSRSASAITLMDIIGRIDGTDLFEQCLLGLPGCGKEHPCALHVGWSAERKRLFDLFSTSTLAQVAQRITDLDLRIRP